jgi:hypothetical protein
MEPNNEKIKPTGSPGRPSNVSYERVDFAIRQILTEKDSFTC